MISTCDLTKRSNVKRRQLKYFYNFECPYSVLKHFFVSNHNIYQENPEGIQGSMNMGYDQCYFQLSPGGIPPRIPNSPPENTQNTKTL